MDDQSDEAILIWAELQVPEDPELEPYFQALLQVPGHEGSGWGRVQERPGTIIFCASTRHHVRPPTSYRKAWERTSSMREFTASPSAQLYRENLESGGITHIYSRETRSRRYYWIRAFLESYVQLFWVYYPTPITIALEAQISQLKGIREPARSINGQDYRDEKRQLHYPLKLWAYDFEFVHGQEAQLMLWPHFWRDADAAEYRHVGKYTTTGHSAVGGRTLLERLGDNLEKVGSIEWKEEFIDFKPITFT
ncbi:Dimeric alpha-beta barrel [Penicillium atrosanguineum]|nr:Dimeric alpha-beta barrel [Penicillium atrosanguineum]